MVNDVVLRNIVCFDICKERIYLRGQDGVETRYVPKEVLDGERSGH